MHDVAAHRDNLDLDLGPHKEHIKAQGKPYTLKDLYTTAAVLRPIKYFKHLTLFVIKDNVPHTAPFYGLPVPPTPRRVGCFSASIVRLAAVACSHCRAEAALQHPQPMPANQTTSHTHSPPPNPCSDRWQP